MTDPDVVARGRARPGGRRPPRGQGRRSSGRSSRVRGRQRRRHPAAARRGAGRRRRDGSCTSRRRRSRTWAARWRARAPVRPTPSTPAAATRGPRRPPSCSRSRRTTRPACAWSSSGRTSCGDRGTPSWSGGSWTARARAGCRCSATGAALIDTTYVDNAVDALVAALHADPAAYGEAYVVTNGEPRPVRRAARGHLRGQRGPDAAPARPGASSRAARARCSTRRGARCPLPGEPPLTRFVAEQLSTAHWFDQRRTREALGWTPRVSLDEGLARLAAWTARQASGDGSLDSARDLLISPARALLPLRPDLVGLEPYGAPAARRAAPAQRQREPVRARAGGRRRHRGRRRRRPPRA